jgi:hypothetical protein
MNRSRLFWLALTTYGVATLVRLGPSLPGAGGLSTWVTVVAAAALLLAGVVGLARGRPVRAVEERALFAYLAAGAALLSVAALLASLLNATG